MKKTILVFVTTTVLSLGVLSFTSQVLHAQDSNTLSTMCQQSGGDWNPQDSTCNYTGSGAECNTGLLGLPAWYKYLNVVPDGDGPCSIVGPPGTSLESSEVDWTRAIGLIALAVVEGMLQIAALVAVGFVIYGGFNYITSQGDPEKAKNARQRIINALIGLVITLAASGAVRFAGALLTR